MKPVALFIVGSPGVGKTTLVTKFLGPIAYLIPKPKWTVSESGLLAAGHYTGGTFDGADMVPYNGVTQALLSWRELSKEHELTIFDGGRFSFEGAVASLVEGGADVRCVYCEAAPDVLSRRRQARGSNQNPAWMKGRETKALRFSKMVPKTLKLEMLGEPYELTNRVRDWLVS
jgi:hypothetical protein